MKYTPRVKCLLVFQEFDWVIVPLFNHLFTYVLKYGVWVLVMVPQVSL
jgi:hypothetical protein